MARRDERADGDLAVVTVAYDSDRVLPDFLASVATATADRPQIVVVDNLPERGEARRIATAAEADYLPLPRNRGYGAAMNAGVARIGEGVRWILISNPDVRLGPGSVDALRSVGAADDGVGAVGPAVLNSDGTLYPSARAVPSIRIGVGHALFGNVWKANPWSRRYHSSVSGIPRDAGWLSGACLLVRREAFERIGGFDEGYFMYFEDVDLGMRLQRAGFRNRYAPDAKVVHAGAHSTAGRNTEMIAEHHRSASRFLAARYPRRWQAPIRWALRAGLAVRSRFVQARARSVDSSGPHTH